MPATLSHPAAARTLALAEATAVRLIDALLADDEAVSRQQFATALREDAKFAQWARDRAEHSDDDSAWSIDDLATWLARNGPDELVSAGELFASTGAEIVPVLAAKLKRLRTLEQRHQAALETEKLAALAEFAAGAGHEINNPIAVICGRVELLLRHEQHPERRRDLAVMHTQAMRVHEMIADLMLFARPPRLCRQPADMAELIDDLIDEVAPRCARQDVALRHRLDQRPLPVNVDRVQWLVALRAVCDNALDALRAGDWLEITVGRGNQPTDDTCQGGSVQAVISDNGPGIDEPVRRHLFDPFFSGRSAGRGLGMGLAKCWRIVTGHGGSITVESQPGEGATFVITLPDEGATDGVSG